MATPEAATDVKTDYPSITFTWTPDGLAYEMHDMSGPMLHAIAGVCSHEAEKLLFQHDMQQAAKNGAGLQLPGGRRI